MHDSEIPRDLLELKTRPETWRDNRKYIREPIPGELRQAADEMIRCYSPSIIRRTLKLDPWKLNKSATKKPARSRNKPHQPAFFKLPPHAAMPELGSSIQHRPTDCRLQIDRPDGSRLTFVLSAFDVSTISALCSDFLRS